MSKIDPMILRVRDVVKNYGGLCAVAGASLDVPRRTTIALVGPNGCGKTSLIKTIFGLQHPDEGSIYFEGEAIDELSPDKVFAAGIVHAFQFPRLFNQMSVLDNLLIAGRGNPGDSFLGGLLARKKWREHEEAMLGRATDTLEMMGLTRLTREPAGSLSGGQKKLLEIARAMMAQPKLLLLDEPAAGVNPVLARKIFEKIEMLRHGGMSLLIIEHRMELVMEFANWVYVMDRGKIVLEGRPAEVAASPLFYEIYIGGEPGVTDICVS
jgi:branched-chain amino acid transport system ATP-binding protein